MPLGPTGSRSGQPVSVVVARERGALTAEAGVVAVRSGLAVEARAHHHDVRTDFGERVVVEPEAAHRARCEVLRDRVGPLHDQAAYERDGIRLLQVERDVALADVEPVVHRRALEPVRVVRARARTRGGSRAATSTPPAAPSRRARRSSGSRSARRRRNRTRGSGGRPTPSPDRLNGSRPCVGPSGVRTVAGSRAAGRARPRRRPRAP